MTSGVVNINVKLNFTILGHFHCFLKEDSLKPRDIYISGHVSYESFTPEV